MTLLAFLNLTQVIKHNIAIARALQITGNTVPPISSCPHQQAQSGQ